MNLGTIYFKTSQGRLEVTARSGTLDARQRRLLIMVDGKKTVNELGAFVRVGELAAALERLLAYGLIESGLQEVDLLLPVAPGFSAASPGEVPRPATSWENFARLFYSLEAMDELGRLHWPVYDNFHFEDRREQRVRKFHRFGSYRSCRSA